MSMRVLATFPGKLGDLLWALPTLRCIAEATGERVGLLTTAQYGLPLLELGLPPYLGLLSASAAWQVEDTAPVSPRTPPPAALDKALARGYDAVWHLGYAGWPEPTLPEGVWTRADIQAGLRGVTLPPLDLQTPWLSVPAVATTGLAVGFTDEWFELKYGVATLVTRAKVCGCTAPAVLVPHGSRWEREAGIEGTTLAEAAGRIGGARVLLADCSALHVLGVALGTKVVVLEPNPHRMHETFWPVGQEGPQVTLVRGNDGLATHDARHCAEAVAAALEVTYG